ncbi:hypothetical protein ACFX2K_038586 [Malus domestica]
MSIEKKSKTSSIAREGPPAVEKLVINLTSSNRKKTKVARSESMAPAMSKMASTISDRIAQHKGFVMSKVSKLTIMKSDKVDSAAKVAPRSTPLTAKTDSPT